MARWMLKQSSANIAELARRTGLPPVLARLLAVRGYKDPQSVLAFLQGREEALADPLLFQDMARAVDIVAEAVRQQTPCAIFGDYDADGIMSTVILLRTLKRLDLEARYYIPSREKEGYGLSKPALAQLAGTGVKLILACDNGISALEEADYANSLGLDLVIFDHHQLAVDEAGGQPLLPQAKAVVDAKRADCGYPFKHYCAAGLCYRFAQALSEALAYDWAGLSQELLPFAAIATVCDIVELTGDNRLLVKAGLPAICGSRNLGLRALLKAVELETANLDTFHLGFIIGPCINASGRLHTADQAVELFMTEDSQAAAELAAHLVALNQQRRDLTEAGVTAALNLVKAQGLDEDKVLVVYCSEVPDSVAGIIAGRLKELYHRPTIVIGGPVGRAILRGSCRSIEGYDIYEALTGCRELLQSFGGHPLAAGLSIAPAQIPAFRSLINQNCGLTAADLQPLYRIDCPLPVALADLTLARRLEDFAPFGKGNEQPCFGDKQLRLEGLTLMGRNEQALRWRLRTKNGKLVEAVDFQHKERLQNEITATYGSQAWQALCRGCCPGGIVLDIIYTLSVNLFNGQEKAQLRIIDFRPAQA